MESASDITIIEEPNVAYANTTESMPEVPSDLMLAGPAVASFVQLHRDPRTHSVRMLRSELIAKQRHRDGLNQTKRRVEQELAVAEMDCQSIEREIRSAVMKNSANPTASGISDELWDEYESFCKSLEPQSRNTDGWSITCTENHQGSYVHYDPDLILFKQCAEDSEISHDGYRLCNFRSESTTIHASDRITPVEYVVEFWPISYPENEAEIMTWSEQYVSKRNPQHGHITILTFGRSQLSTDWPSKLSVPGRVLPWTCSSHCLITTRVLEVDGCSNTTSTNLARII